MYLPWQQFVPVKRARVDPNAAPLDTSKARQFGLVLSRFEFNGLPNPHYKAGRFSLKVCIWPSWFARVLLALTVVVSVHFIWADFGHLEEVKR